MTGHDPLGGLDPADARHPDVHQHQVPRLLVTGRDGLLTGRGTPDLGPRHLTVDQVDHEGAQIVLVLDDQNAVHADEPSVPVAACRCRTHPLTSR
ncbi:hypothetical protein SDC9_105287 [bioreactor metagenome]|uniref:Uncharacterized protein n=1 Tax=bioreactor metagenome TaxID=1076179 RepID=A0A645B084_9ZZZZ